MASPLEGEARFQREPANVRERGEGSKKITCKTIEVIIVKKDGKTMFKELELLLSQYPNILNALVATGTIGAVFTSLYIANCSTRPKIKSNVWSSEILNSDEEGLYHPGTGEKYISLSITNEGQIPIFLNYFFCFSWGFIFQKVAIMQCPFQPVFKDKEFEISPYKSSTFVLCKKDEFIMELNKFVNKYNYPRWLLNFLKFEIRTSNNVKFKSQIDKKLLNEIIKGVK